MIHYKTIVIPQHEEQFVNYVSCDCCGEDIERDVSGYDVGEVEIYCKEGTAYPEGGHGTKIVLDMCPTCFKEKLVPFLQSIGTVRTEEWDY